MMVICYSAEAAAIFALYSFQMHTIIALLLRSIEPEMLREYSLLWM